MATLEPVFSIQGRIVKLASKSVLSMMPMMTMMTTMLSMMTMLSMLMTLSGELMAE